MNAIMRKAGRGSTLLIGTVALAFSLAACGGGTDDSAETTSGEDTSAAETTEDTTTEEDTASDDAAADDTASDDAAADDTASDDGAADDAAAGSTDVTDADLSAAKDQFFGFMTALLDGDYEAACGFVIDPTTNEPIQGDMVTACASGMATEGDSVAASGLTSDTLDLLKDQTEAVDNGDGTIGISLAGSDFPYPMTKSSDGKWYMQTQ